MEKQQKLLEHLNKMTEKQKTSTLITVVLVILGELNANNMQRVIDNILLQEIE